MRCKTEVNDGSAWRLQLKAHIPHQGLVRCIFINLTPLTPMSSEMDLACSKSFDMQWAPLG